MNSESLISVIVPIYNTEANLLKCLNSLVNQTYANLEIILIDDGSFDQSGSICDEFASKDNRILVIHEQNSGVSKARNNGIDCSNGDYYHFMDGDDYIEEYTYEFCLGKIDECNCEIVVFEYLITYLKYETSHKSNKDFYGLYEGPEEVVKINFRTPFVANKLFSKRLVNGNEYKNRFKENIHRGEDSIFLRDTVFKASIVLFVNEPLYHYVQSTESACRGRFKKSQLTLIDKWEDDKKFYEKYFPDYLPTIYVNEMESIIMLYSDMYHDYLDYSKEQNILYSLFVNLYKSTKHKISVKQLVKFNLFMLNPNLFMFVHKINILSSMLIEKSKC